MADVVEAAQYYVGQSGELGEAFLNEVDTCVQQIVDHPTRQRIICGDIRCRRLKRFPFGLYYRLTTGGIQIVTVKHQRRHPDYGMDR